MVKGIFKVDRDEVKKVVGSILGGEEEKELDLEKSYTKFICMHVQAKRYALLFDRLSSDQSLSTSKFDTERELIKCYANLIHTEMRDKFENIDLTGVKRAVASHPFAPKELQDDISLFLKYYNAMKQSTLIHTIINTGSNIIEYKRFLENADALDPSFLTKSSMLTLEPVQDLKVNFKLMYMNMSDERDQKFILMSLHKLYDITKKMFEERGKVDIDTGAFVRAVHATVEKLKTELPQCGLAFKKILESTDLLTKNYDSYYKDYVGCNNSMVIAENFIQDVAGKVDKSPRLAFQFQQIIKHLRKLTSRLSMADPKYKQTFDTLLSHADKSYKEVERALEEEGHEIQKDESDTE